MTLFSCMLSLSIPFCEFSTPIIHHYQYQYQSGLASRYRDPGDVYENFKQPLACEQKIKKNKGLTYWNYLYKRGVAHRTLPCEKPIYVCSGKKCTLAYVIDRGPYGALDRHGRWHRRDRLLPGERWRGIVDLLPPVANRLHIWGLGKVVIWY